MFAGLLAGYLFYDMLHYATHHFAMKRGVWLWLKKYHMRHHYQDDHVGYRRDLAALGLCVRHQVAPEEAEVGSQEAGAEP